MVSGAKMLAKDPLSPVSYKVEPPWIELVCTAHPNWIMILGIWWPSQQIATMWQDPLSS